MIEQLAKDSLMVTNKCLKCYGGHTALTWKGLLTQRSCGPCGDKNTHLRSRLECFLNWCVHERSSTDTSTRSTGHSLISCVHIWRVIKYLYSSPGLLTWLSYKTKIHYEMHLFTFPAESAAARRCKRSFATSRLPYLAATCRGVKPFWKCEEET
jgi:hypothetical protein